jgi:hypothetical protein
MLTTVLCPRCARFINHFSLSILQNRYISTTNDSLPAPINDDIDASNDTDRNISRLPDDVYRHFKGRNIINYFRYIYSSVG